MRYSLQNKVRVLVIDDSPLVRRLLAIYLGRLDGIDVVGAASDAYDARDKIVQLEPDVLTLDINMPKMDGIKFLDKLMRSYPIPTIMVSGVTEANSEMALDALRIGAVDFVAKPRGTFTNEFDSFVRELSEKITAASTSRVQWALKRGLGSKAGDRLILKQDNVVKCDRRKIIAIGASTGGTQAISDILSACPSTMPGIVIVQHMPRVFTKAFAKRLDKICELKVCEAEGGMRIAPGEVLVAPGDYQMEVRKDGRGYYASVYDGQRVNRHRPSVDVLFDSVAKCARSDGVGVIMTGMGDDGARGLLKMRDAGAKTIAQNKESSVVFGMPRRAIELGAAERIVALSDIPGAIMSASRGANYAMSAV